MSKSQQTVKEMARPLTAGFANAKIGREMRGGANGAAFFLEFSTLLLVQK